MLRTSDEFDDKRYCVLRQLGKGTFGRVVAMEDTKDGSMVAVKVVRSIEKYTREAEIEADIIWALQRTLKEEVRFPIARLLRCFESRGHYCLVMEAMGPSLYHRLRDIRRTLERRGLHRETGSYFSMGQISIVARDCFTALAHLHKIKLTHTDLKPENILLVEPKQKHAPPKDYSVALIDFGGATWEEEHHSSIVCTRQVGCKLQDGGNGGSKDGDKGGSSSGGRGRGSCGSRGSASGSGSGSSSCASSGCAGGRSSSSGCGCGSGSGRAAAAVKVWQSQRQAGGTRSVMLPTFDEAIRQFL